MTTHYLTLAQDASDWSILLKAVVPALVGFFVAVSFAVIVRNRRKNSPPKAICPRCGYQLIETVEGCPECGWAKRG